MTLLALARVEGIPGPKGSVNAFCVTCAKARRSQKVVVKEQSEVGARFRKVVARQMAAGAVSLGEPYGGDVETRLVFFIPRQKRVRAGIESDQWVPSHSGARPTFRNSGDVEKHARNVHDALMDAKLIEDDDQVWRTVVEKRWADATERPGAVIEVHTSDLSGPRVKSMGPSLL